MVIEITEDMVKPIAPRDVLVLYFKNLKLDIADFKKKETTLCYVMCKRVITHLRNLKWTDYEISELVEEVAKQVKNRNIINPIQYLWGTARNITTAPAARSISDNSKVAEYSDWIRHEIARLSK